MAQDLAPELWELIQRLRKEYVDNDRAIGQFLDAVERGTAKPEDVRRYAERLGTASAEAFKEAFRPGVLPDDRLYFNIANRTVRPALEQDFQQIQNAAGQVQKTLDTAAGIGLNAVDAPAPEDRIRGIVDGASSAETLEEALRYLTEPVVTFAQAAYDSWVRENAEFRYTSGMEPRIVRTMHGRGCPWCRNLAGVFRYEDVRYGSDVFRRHAFCRCTVTFESGRTRQDVWTKRVWQASPEELERRKTLGREITRYTPEQAAELAAQTDPTLQSGDSAKNALANTPDSGIMNGNRGKRPDFSKAVFGGRKDLDWHWEKHKDEFPGWTKEQYLQRARELLMKELSDGILEEFERSDGSISRYYFPDNEFVASTPDWNIRTFFKPFDGTAYWEEEHERN